MLNFLKDNQTLLLIILSPILTLPLAALLVLIGHEPDLSALHMSVTLVILASSIDAIRRSVK